MKTKFHRSMPACGTKNTIALLAIASLLAVAPAGWAASPSELLEHGIYAEETKGDLDAALKLYQQAVSEAKGVQAVAAQAQFRLGVCHYKKGDSAAATAAFEQVIKDYPEQKELVTQAHDYLFRACPCCPLRGWTVRNCDWTSKTPPG
jgi:outer membrane protein assembly factor BamD (BamD/ComL family)